MSGTRKSKRILAEILTVRNVCYAAFVWLAACCYISVLWAASGEGPSGKRTWRVALVQFDAVPEQPERNLHEMDRLARQAVTQGARFVMFHEGTLADYTPRLDELAEHVPDGPACRRMASLAKQLRCFISFGLSERDGDRFYITQVFVGPEGMIYRYRKAWLWREEKDEGYRNEHARYDPGSGPERFTIDGIVATCFICADGEAPRCIQRAKALRPQLVFYPNNRGGLPDFPVLGARAREIGAPMLVTNRIGKSWNYACQGGCVAFDAQGNVLAKANRQGREDVLVVDLSISVSAQPGPSGQQARERHGKAWQERMVADLPDLKARASSGDPNAQVSLGIAYRDGKGVARNYADALAWFRKAAEKNDAAALDNVGWMYEHGLGTAPTSGRNQRLSGAGRPEDRRSMRKAGTSSSAGKRLRDTGTNQKRPRRVCTLILRTPSGAQRVRPTGK
jgi:predicted amidohydrolase